MSISTNNKPKTPTKDAILAQISQIKKTSLRCLSPAAPPPPHQTTSMQVLTGGLKMCDEEDPTVSTRIWQQRPLTRNLSERSVKFCNLYDQPDRMFNSFSGQSKVALITSIKNGEVADLKKELALSDFNINRRINGRYAMHYAADYGQYSIIEFLLEKGADVNAVDEYGVTPLLVCVWEGYVDCVKLLLQHGAASDGITPDEKTYYEVADKEEIRKLLKAHEKICDGDDEEMNSIQKS